MVNAMTYHGYVQNGQIILSEPVALPDGAKVFVDVRGEEGLGEVGRGDASGKTDTLSQVLLKHAGKAVDLPEDAARNHDHYLYGSPKK